MPSVGFFGVGLITLHVASNIIYGLVIHPLQLNSVGAVAVCSFCSCVFVHRPFLSSEYVGLQAPQRPCRGAWKHNCFMYITKVISAMYSNIVADGGA